mmetsp:Transcript_29997/g.92545  ORF Transcript_29997/g.92545 Transcript_29997/m.92545 type:complete len:402 (+) Transcript_29997:1077-2282(+)
MTVGVSAAIFARRLRVTPGLAWKVRAFLVLGRRRRGLLAAFVGFAGVRLLAARRADVLGVLVAHGFRHGVVELVDHRTAHDAATRPGLLQPHLAQPRVRVRLGADGPADPVAIPRIQALARVRVVRDGGRLLVQGVQVVPEDAPHGECRARVEEVEAPIQVLDQRVELPEGKLLQRRVCLVPGEVLAQRVAGDVVVCSDARPERRGERRRLRRELGGEVQSEGLQPLPPALETGVDGALIGIDQPPQLGGVGKLRRDAQFAVPHRPPVDSVLAPFFDDALQELKGDGETRHYRRARQPITVRTGGVRREMQAGRVRIEDGRSCVRRHGQHTALVRDERVAGRGGDTDRTRRDEFAVDEVADVVLFGAHEGNRAELFPGDSTAHDVALAVRGDDRRDIGHVE